VAAQHRAQLEAQAARERKAEDERRARQRYHLEQELEAAANAYQRGKLTFREYQQRLLAIMKEYHVPFKEGASALGFQLAQGLRDAFVEVQKAARGLAEEILKQFANISVRVRVDLVGLPKKLPGRQHGGPVFAGRPYIVGEAGAELFVPSSNGRVVAGATAGRAAAPVNVYVTVQGNVTSERDLAMAIRDELVRYTRRNGGSALGNFG